MIRKILGLALIGFLVVTLAGPVFTILAFALVGLAVWSMFRAVFGGAPVNWPRLRTGASRLGRVAFRSSRFLGRVMAHELAYLGRTLGRNGAWLSRAAWNRARAEAPLVGGFVAEVVSGAAIGGLLGLAVGWRQAYLPIAIGIGAGSGAAIAVLVGFLNWRASRRTLYTSF